MKRLLLFLLLPFCLKAEQRVVDLYPLGKIVYHFEKGLCEKIVRLSPTGKVRYEHTYQYDDNNNIVSENLIGDLGTIEYSGSLQEGYLIAKTPFGEEKWSQEDSSPFEETAIEKIYDHRGNLVQKGTTRFFYQDNTLVVAVTDQLKVFLAYDNEGRRIAKKTVSEYDEDEEYYLFLGQNEIASLSSNGEIKWLRIPGMTTHPDMVRAIAIETKDATYAPIYDHRWNIVKLINIEDQTIYETRPDPFGQNLKDLKGCPWTFCSKRYDPDLALVNFGHRDYDPQLKEWTTPDPLMQAADPYQYCLGDPLQYIDPDGQFAIFVPIVIWGGATIAEVLVDTAIVAGASWLSYEAVKHGNQIMQQAHKPKEGKQKDGMPKSNVDQNDQAKGAVREIERKIGRKLTDAEREGLHRHISKQGYGYHEIVEEGIGLFGNY